MGLKHIPTPKQTTKDEILQDLEIFKNKLGWSNFFWIKDDQKPTVILDKPIVPKSSGKTFHFAEPFDQPLILLKRLEDTVENYDYIYPTYSSSNPLKKLSEFLKVNPQLKIVATDKNLGMAAFDIQDYNEMVLTHLTSDNYELVNQDSTLAPVFNRAFTRSRTNLSALIQSLEDNNSVPLNLIGILKSFLRHNKVTLPNFHVLPKLHKIISGNPIIPSRPIVGATNWFTTPVSKLLSKLLRPIIKRQDHIATNTFDVASDLVFFNNFSKRILEDPDHPVLIVTMDISSLYTNINLNLLKELVRERNSELENMLTYINDHNYFQYDGKTFKQLDGIAMGTNSAPEIANYYLLYLLDPKIKASPKVKFYKRFLDDLLLLWNGTIDEFNEFATYLNLLIPGITFTHQISNHFGEFLDLRIAVTSFGSSKPQITYSTHQKALNKYAYISPKSCHPVHTLKGFIFGELQRYATNSSSYFHYANTKRMFMQRLLARGYSHSFLTPIFKKHGFMTRSLTQKQEPQLNMSLRYSYRPGLLFLSKRIKSAAERSLSNYIPGTRFIISWKKSPNIFNKLCKSKITEKQSLFIMERNSAIFHSSSTLL